MSMTTLKQVRLSPAFTGQAFSALLVGSFLDVAHSYQQVNVQEMSATKTRRSSRKRSSFLLLACSILSALTASGLSAQTLDPKRVPPDLDASIAAAVQTHFGSAVEAVTAFKPYFVIGDFNGDGGGDIVVVVRIKGQRSELPPDVAVYNPFERPKAVFPTDPLATPTLALAIIHGGRFGSQTQPATEKFLLFGQSPVLILNYGRVASGGPDEVKDLMELLKKGSRKFRDSGWPPAAAKGAAIVLGTEATDSILYWNGKNYRWEEAAGGE